MERFFTRCLTNAFTLNASIGKFSSHFGNLFKTVNSSFGHVESSFDNLAEKILPEGGIFFRSMSENDKKNKLFAKNCISSKCSLDT